MPSMSSISRLVGLGVVAALASVSCGDDDDDDVTANGGSTNGGKAGSKATAGSNNNAGVPGTGAAGGGNEGGMASEGGAATVAMAEVAVMDLTADEAAAADNVDPNLINGWGLSFDLDPDEDTAFWVSAEGTGVSTIYGADGVPAALVVTIPAAGTDGAGGAGGSSSSGAGGETALGAPTGQVYNPTTEFSGDKFIFATADGVIAGWEAGTEAVVRSDRSTDEASYLGLTLVPGDDPVLLAANFHEGEVEVFDADYVYVDAELFVDPALPSGYAPFNVAALGDKVYVAYAKQDAAQEEEVVGPGLGYVSVFEPDGSFDKRLISGGVLNAPWGLALAPAGFSPAPGALIVGNFGDGMIHSFDPDSGELMAEFVDGDGNPIAIEGLWALAFGPKKDAEDLSEQLFFTAGPEDETHGLFGVLSAP